MSDRAPVLVVDDDHDLRDTLAEVLQDEGHPVVTAPDGLAALDYQRREPPPGLILLDWMMPRFNGEQFVAAMAADPDLVRIPVIVFSADTRVVAREQPPPVVRCLLKPPNLEELLALVERHRRGGDG